MAAVRIIFTWFFVMKAVDAISNCTLVVENEEEFDEDIIDYISDDSLTEIIQYELDFSSLGPDFNLRNRTNPLACEPEIWYRVKDKEKARLLLAHKGHLFKLFLSNVYKETKVRLTTTPPGCIHNISVNEMEKFIRDFLLNDFQIAKKTFRSFISISDFAKICTAHQANDSDKEYWCCTYDLHNRIVCEHIGKDAMFEVASNFVAALILMLYLYSPLLIPHSSGASTKLNEEPLIIPIVDDLTIDINTKKMTIGGNEVDINKTAKMTQFQSWYKSQTGSGNISLHEYGVVLKEKKVSFVKEGDPVITTFWSLISFAVGLEKYPSNSKSKPPFYYFLIPAVTAFILYLYALLGTLRKKHDACLKSLVARKTTNVEMGLCKRIDSSFHFQQTNAGVKLKINQCILYKMDGDRACVDKKILAVEDVCIILFFNLTVICVVYVLGSTNYISFSNQLFITLIFSLLPSLVKLVKDR
ncbi:hypothetical protein Bpfe_006610 [Biomphalaria pfeifferi]|uniref:Uncharacterized protein n=1 Tax=Biomphalaria pfeifferi TaxID=112525 RepID=A0AAD8C0D2_BIOPF|nr:hypothetical protein Bpfe_006610 [Biomphalaria pfeifferi]